MGLIFGFIKLIFVLIANVFMAIANIFMSILLFFKTSKNKKNEKIINDLEQKYGTEP